MSQQNNQDNSLVIAFAFIGAAFMMLAIAIAIGLAFITFILTIVCAYVWQFEKTLAIGPFSIEPDEAGAFILRGIAGAFLLPGFALFAVVFFDVPLRDDIWGYLFAAGYVCGSLGIEFLIAQAEANGQVYVPPPAIDRQPPSTPALPAPRDPAGPWGAPEGKPSFRFASWDDEEELRR